MVSSNQLQQNLDTAARLLRQAAEAGAQLAVLPETFAMFSAKAQRGLAQQESGAAPVVQRFIAEQAQTLGLWIVAGTLPLTPLLNQPGNDRVAAACLIFDDQGQPRGRYDKIHLFDVDVNDAHGSYRESDTFIAGDKVLVIDTPLGRLGVAVCYDIRFQEMFRLMADQAVDLIAVPAAFTLLTGQAHWQALLRARAIENQCYIIGANQGGEHTKNRASSGGSVIIDGWGKVLDEAAMGESIVVADVDLQRLAEQRLAMPVSQHRRFDIVPKS
ncbi:MAG: nitrilase [Oceanicoccus sp.]|jgi:nitrilase